MRRVGLFSVIVSLGLCSGLSAQVQFESEPLGNKASIEDSFRPQLQEFTRLLTGEPKYTPMNKDFVVRASKYYIYRVTWLGVQADTKPTTQRTLLEQARLDFKYAIDGLVKNEGKNAEVAAVFCTELVERFKEVFEKPFAKNRLAHVNAGMMLPDLARTQNEVVRRYLAELLKDPKTHDLTKFFAIKGMGEFFPAREFFVLVDQEAEKKKRRDREVESIDLLVKFIEHNWNLADDVDPGEVEAVRYVRREAIRSLGLAKVAAVDVHKGKAEGIAVYTLMKVLTGEGFDPPPSLPERLEAALGICHLTKSPISEYQPDLGIYLVASFTRDFVNAYQQDHREFRGTDKSPAHPWKFHAERFRQALDGLQNNIRSKKAQDLRDAAQAPLGAVRSHQAIGEGQLGRLEELVEAIRPEDLTVFRSLPPLALQLR